MSATTTPVTREAFLNACQEQRKAKNIEASAKRMKDAARLVIIKYAEENPEEFSPASDSETGRTLEFTHKSSTEALLAVSKIHAVRVTYPEKKPLPARLNEARSDEIVELLDDALPEAVDVLFERHYAFRGVEAIMQFAGEFPDGAATLARLLMPFTLPAEDGEKMSPRVEVK
jgi:hypothetical protein